MPQLDLAGPCEKCTKSNKYSCVGVRVHAAAATLLFKSANWFEFLALCAFSANTRKWHVSERFQVFRICDVTCARFLPSARSAINAIKFEFLIRCRPTDTRTRSLNYTVATTTLNLHESLLWIQQFARRTLNLDSTQPEVALPFILIRKSFAGLVYLFLPATK